MNSYFYKSPVGFLNIQVKDNHLYSLSKTRLSKRSAPLSTCRIHKHLYQLPAVSKPGITKTEMKLVRQLAEQLTKYFSGKKIKKWNISLFPQGTVFQQKVWEALYRIPYGQTSSYSELAKAAGYPKAVRAVGSACGKKPLVNCGAMPPGAGEKWFRGICSGFAGEKVFAQSRKK